ncbi:MAG: AAA family ATPase [Pseudomonadota bacterium]
MNFYQAIGKPSGQATEDLPVSQTESWKDPKDYLPDPGLVSAVNVALLLGQPLLLTGAPGSGKTELIYNLALEFGVKRENVLDHVVKSTTSATDLFYIFNHARQFRDAARGAEDMNPEKYLTLNALGRAILLAQDRNAVPAHLAPLVDKAMAGFPPVDGPDTRRRVFVLIDEIDKAPRDIPNDVLSEIDRFEFEIPELTLGDNQVPRFKASPEFRPIVVFTSNSEKQLPETFLRRCVYYHIEQPSEAKLRRIVEKRFPSIGTIGDRHPFADALALFLDFQSDRSQLQKRPSTAELLSWTAVLAERFDLKKHSIKAKDQTPYLKSSLTALLKTEADLLRGEKILNRWMARAT